MSELQTTKRLLNPSINQKRPRARIAEIVCARTPILHIIMCTQICASTVVDCFMCSPLKTNRMAENEQQKIGSNMWLISERRFVNEKS